MEPLLEANLLEHEELGRLDDGRIDRYSSINARVLLLGGGKSPRRMRAKCCDRQVKRGAGRHSMTCLAMASGSGRARSHPAPMAASGTPTTAKPR
jgi:hypothetical protein